MNMGSSSTENTDTVEAKFKMNFGVFFLDASLSVPSNGITAIFGPSGSGKTSLLHCIAGLEKSSEGYLKVNHEIWQDHDSFLPVHQRPIGYVFQEASLFSHLSVLENLKYGYQRTPPEKRLINLDHIADLLGLQEFISRKNTESLSGGEKQRVAIGRALLTSPRLLLMDEPLSALDEKSKAEIYPYLERLRSDLEIPIFYVSHSLQEVARLADQLALMDKGKIIAVGQTNEIITQLDLPFHRTWDNSSVLDTVIARHDHEFSLSALEYPGGTLWVNGLSKDIGKKVRVQILARYVSLSLLKPEQTSIINIIPAKIDKIKDWDEASVLVRLLIGSKTLLLSQITKKSCKQLLLKPGMDVYAQIKSVSLIT